MVLGIDLIPIFFLKLNSFLYKTMYICFMEENYIPITNGGSIITATSGLINANSTTHITNINTWGTPKRVQVNEYSDRVEMVYKEISTIYYLTCPDQRVFKIIFSCIDGKWNKSERIYGKVIPSQDEYYEFED